MSSPILHLFQKLELHVAVVGRMVSKKMNCNFIFLLKTGSVYSYFFSENCAVCKNTFLIPSVVKVIVKAK